MNTIRWSRRSFLAAVTVLGSTQLAEACWRRRRRRCWSPPGPVDPPVMVRQDIRELTAGHVAALEHGVQVMKSRPPTDPTSWQFQANMHGTFDMPTHPLWNQCRHGSIHFLTWHRGYIYFFERILRAASGDPTLCLPYWNWSEQLGLPLPFRNAASPLFDSTRAINDGSELPPEATVDDLQMALDSLAFWPWPGFSAMHEGSPHGSVHIDVSGNMSLFETAAQDPIFWLHHANVDRIWDIWLNLNAGRANPHDAPFLDQQFTFADETGSERIVKVRDILDSRTLNYRYDDVPNPPASVKSLSPARALAPHAHAASQPMPTIVAAPAEEPMQKALGFKPERVPLPLLADQAEMLRGAAASPRRGKILVEVQGIQLDDPPTFPFGVYLHLPEGVTDRQKARPYYVGSLHLFGKGKRAAESHREQGPQAHGQHALNDFDQVFDASAVVAKLRQDRTWKEDALSVTLLPLAPTPPKGSEEPAIARAQASAEMAKLTYRRIVLKVIP